MAILFGLAAGAGLLFLAIGLLLPGQWTAERSMRIEAPLDRVFVQVDSLVLWNGWTIWGDVPSSLEGPGRGVGATRSWDDPAFGSGRFAIVVSEPPSAVAYRVVVQGGALTIEGRFTLVSDGSTTRVTWREEGDFGWNPLMGYVARTMGGSQGDELERSLQRLKAIAESDP